MSTIASDDLRMRLRETMARRYGGGADPLRERLRSAIVETIGAANPKLAAELLWHLIDLHTSIFERLDDSSGRVG